MENIDLYDIHDTAFERRPECNNCTWHRGEGVEDAECVQLEAMNHEGCPFVEAVIDDVEGMFMVTNPNYDLMRLFIEEVMELNISDEERSGINTRSFMLFIVNNKQIFQEKLTEFFTRRLRDENNYRGVNVQVS